MSFVVTESRHIFSTLSPDSVTTFLSPNFALYTTTPITCCLWLEVVRMCVFSLGYAFMFRIYLCYSHVNNIHNTHTTNIIHICMYADIPLNTHTNKQTETCIAKPSKASLYYYIYHSQCTVRFIIIIDTNEFITQTLPYTQIKPLHTNGLLTTTTESGVANVYFICIYILGKILTYSVIIHNFVILNKYINI